MSNEFLVTLLIAIGLGWLLISFTLPYFKELSGITAPVAGIFMKIAGYTGIVIIVGYFVCSALVYNLGRKTLKESLFGYVKWGNRRFNRAGMLLQLAISLGFIFCTFCMMKQIYHLNHTDLGFDRNRIGSISAFNTQLMPYADRIKGIAAIEDVYKTSDPFLPRMGSSTTSFNAWEGKTDDVPLSVDLMYISPQFIDFFKIKLLSGQNFDDNTPENEALINEEAARLLGWENPIGKILPGHGGNNWTIRGVIKNLYFDSPTAAIKPYIYLPQTNAYTFVFKYRENMRGQAEQAITQLIRSDHPGVEVKFTYMDDVYKNFNKSENALILVLKILSGICLLIAVFGIYSMIALLCEQRRKEVAIRKVNGALVIDIMNLFFNEYLLLVAIAAMIAFPVGYVIVKPWIEQYVKQISISWWIYAVIFAVLALIGSLTILIKVWKMANSNPAEVLKAE